MFQPDNCAIDDIEDVKTWSPLHLEKSSNGMINGMVMAENQPSNNVLRNATGREEDMDVKDQC